MYERGDHHGEHPPRCRPAFIPPRQDTDSSIFHYNFSLMSLNSIKIARTYSTPSIADQMSAQAGVLFVREMEDGVQFVPAPSDEAPTISVLNPLTRRMEEVPSVQLPSATRRFDLEDGGRYANLSEGMTELGYVLRIPTTPYVSGERKRSTATVKVRDIDDLRSLVLSIARGETRHAWKPTKAVLIELFPQLAKSGISAVDEDRSADPSISYDDLTTAEKRKRTMLIKAGKFQTA